MPSLFRKWRVKTSSSHSSYKQFKIKGNKNTYKSKLLHKKVALFQLIMEFHDFNLIIN